MLWSIIVVALTVAGFCTYTQPALIANWKRPKGTKVLPGPRGLPLIGNLLDIPPFHSWLKFKAWADVFGDIFALNVAGRLHVVISNERIANELLRERGNIYSSREQLPMAGELLSDNLRPLLLPYNHRWRRGRKLMHKLTSSTVAHAYEPIQSYESKRLLYNLTLDPTRYESFFEQYASGVVFRIGFGRSLNTGEEPEFKRIVQVNHNLERLASPGSYLVDSLPFLKYLPEFLAPFKREGRLLHMEELDLFRKLQDDVKSELEHGTAKKSFSAEFQTNRKNYDLSDDEGAYVLGTLFEAGSGTTAAAMLSLCLAMCHSQEWQTKMQEEVDRIVGDRMPEFSDISQLPTVRAVVKEVLRWRPVTAGGFPHQLTRDDVYKDYFLPAGTVVHANQWAIHRDPDLYPDPENFRPDRWLSPKFPTYREPLDKWPNLQNFSCFGFGRRICPGQNIVERSLYILTARIAWAFDFRKSKDENNVEIPIPLYDYTTGFNSQPKPFSFSLLPRSPVKAEAVRDAWKTACENA